MNKKSDQKSRETALKKINKLNKVSKANKPTVLPKNMKEKNKNIRKKITKKELTKGKNIIKEELTKNKKKNKKELTKNIKITEKDKKIVHQNKKNGKIFKKSDKIAKKSDKKHNKEKYNSKTSVSRRLPLIKNQSGGLGGIGFALLDMFISIPPVFVNFYDLASNMGNEFSSLQKLPDQLKNAAQTQPGQPLANT